MDSTTLANYSQIASFLFFIAAMVWPMLKGQWPPQPHVIAYVFLAIWALVTTYLYFDKPKVTAYQERTHLKLLFPGGGQLPQPQSQVNIYRWYALRNVTVLFDKKGNRTDIPSWTVVLTFDKEISPTFLHTAFNSPNSPAHEVRDLSPRHAIIVIGGEIPAGTVEFSVNKPES